MNFSQDPSIMENSFIIFISLGLTIPVVTAMEILLEKKENQCNLKSLIGFAASFSISFLCFIESYRISLNFSESLIMTWITLLIISLLVDFAVFQTLKITILYLLYFKFVKSNPSSKCSLFIALISNSSKIQYKLRKYNERNDNVSRKTNL